MRAVQEEEAGDDGGLELGQEKGEEKERWARCGHCGLFLEFS